ncbi:MAG: hypothetical protein ACI9SX_001325, partial [Pseudoalteromonas tetraodonis]
SKSNSKSTGASKKKANNTQSPDKSSKNKRKH